MSKNTAVAEPETSNFRLPRTVVPSRYELRLTPDLKEFKFDGEEVVLVDVKEPVKEILVNAVELEISSAEIINDKGTKYSAAITMDESTQRAKLTFKETIDAGTWKLHIRFVGILNDKLAGFYRSKYKDPSGTEKWIASTQFEATEARRAFPCWDEPDFKAVFQSTLIVDESLTALSNAGVDSEKKLGNGKKEVRFKDTIKMPTYLVAYIVGEFEATEPIMADNTPIRIYAPPGKIGLAKFAQDIARHSLMYFAKYYGVPYAGDKLDLVAIPDFAFGAMENLGCVTFRETALLVDEKNASHAEQERVADVVAHENAHMWFGDLATMSWWNGLWLNEAFATFAEMRAVDNWKPKWKRWETFGVSRAAALLVDGLKSSRPIEFPVRWPKEAEGMFDVLTYQKGASVLRMLEQYLTEPVFQKGISLYLDKHKFANTETSDLWDALEKASGQPVVAMMDSWIFHPGYPMISAELENDHSVLSLSQQRFLYRPEKEHSKQLYQVPIMIRAKVNNAIVTKKVLLTQPSTKVDLGGKADWVIVNEGGHGFYRVRYSKAMLEALTVDEQGILSPIERFNLINDTWAAVIAGHTPLEHYLKMTMLFVDERDKNVWSSIASSLTYLDRVVPEDSRADFEAWVRRLVTPAHTTLGWYQVAGEDELAGQLRGLLISTLGVIGNCAETQKRAKEQYEKYKANKDSVDPNIISALVNNLAHSGGNQQYKEFEESFKSAKTPQDEERYLFALASFKQKELLTQTLDKCINGEARTQDAPYLLRNVMMNNNGRELGWDFLKKHWDTANAKYPSGAIARMCEGITALIDAKLEKDVVAFFAAHPVQAGAKTVDQHMERLNVAVQFKEREAKTLKDGFRA